VGLSKLLPKDIKSQATASVPLQRFGKIKDIEYMTLFLASNAGDWITGNFFVVDGGAWLTSGSFNVERMSAQSKL